MNRDFVERDDLGFKEQLKDFALELSSVGAALGFTGTEITEAATDAAYMEYIISHHGNVQAFSQAFTSFKDDLRYGPAPLSVIPVLAIIGAPPTTVEAGIEARFRQKAAKAKAAVGYTKSMGENLRIEAPEVTFDPATGKPTFRIQIQGGKPTLIWRKGGFEGVEIHKKAGAAAWAKLDIDTKSPYVDNSIQPTDAGVDWKYKMIYILNDQPVGLYSDEVTVVVKAEV